MGAIAFRRRFCSMVLFSAEPISVGTDNALHTPMMNVSKSDILHLEANGMQALDENFGPKSQGRASAGVYIQRPSDSDTLAIIP